MQTIVCEDNLKAVKVLCAYAYKEKYVDYLITAEIKNVKEPKTLIHTFSREEIKKMMEHTAPCLFHPSNSPIYLYAVVLLISQILAKI